MFGSYHQEWSKKKIKFILNLFTHKYFITKSIIDIGAGSGEVGAAFFRLGADVTALDARQEHLQIINKKFNNIKTIKQDLDKDFKLNRKYNIALHFGTLCHLTKWREHLNSVCTSVDDLILETAVCDSDEEGVNFEILNDNDAFDGSFGGKGSRTSAKEIEKIIKQNGMHFVRLDIPDLNYQKNIYNWETSNSGRKDLFLRRLWVCSKRDFIVSQISKKYPKNKNTINISSIAPEIEDCNFCKLPAKEINETKEKLNNQEISVAEIIEEKNINNKLNLENSSTKQLVKDNEALKTNFINSQYIQSTQKIKIHHYIPWNTEKNIGKCYNEFMELIGDDDWACFLDGDAVHTTTYFGANIEAIVANNPSYDLFTCYTNRIGQKYQIAPDSRWDNDSQEYHRKIGEDLWEKNGTNVINITNNQPLSGVLILINKKKWSYVGGFKEEKMLSVDNDIHLKFKYCGFKVGLMTGIYVQHWYRGGKGGVSHLK